MFYSGCCIFVAEVGTSTDHKRGRQRSDVWLWLCCQCLHEAYISMHTTHHNTVLQLYNHKCKTGKQHSITSIVIQLYSYTSISLSSALNLEIFLALPLPGRAGLEWVRLAEALLTSPCPSSGAGARASSISSGLLISIVLLW
jgi:hypothetical protein